MILDATCGLKQMWFEKNDAETVYLDMRHGNIEYGERLLKSRPDYYGNHIIAPTIIADNRSLPFKDNCFDMVLYDPPQIISDKATGLITIKYTVLNPITWTMDLSKAISELFRVLIPSGFFVFKWAENSKTIKEVLKLFPYKPLFGTNTSNKNATFWVVFRKRSMTKR